ncbi:MAG: AAA family ATPase [Thiolinea sp.]
MDITLKNLGPISEANFTVGDLTVICGKNNTGKTYITYALYGFLSDWNSIDYWEFNDADGVDPNLITVLIHSKKAILPLDDFIEQAGFLLKISEKHFTRKIAGLFGGHSSKTTQNVFSINVNLKDKMADFSLGRMHFNSDSPKMAVLDAEIDRENSSVILNLSNQDGIKDDDLALFVNFAIKRGAFESIVYDAFIASTERTGAVLFQREVDFTRSRLIDILKETNINPQQLLGRFTAEYPLPVKHNIDFIRDLPNIIRRQSSFSQQHPEILQAFADIAGGAYVANSSGRISYIPSNQPNLNLSLAESSSTVRSLVDIGFYLHHVAEKGKLLMVDEPELNLHPENQRKIARLFAMLVNAGIRVFITTHSDYIIKEFNTLLLLNKEDERLQEIAKREGYQANELLKPEQLNIYMTVPDPTVIDRKAYTLIPAKITAESGIELKTFDDTIEDMNRIQDEIVWG